MSATKILIAAAVAAILSTLACAKPRHIRSNEQQIEHVDLDRVLNNNTVCPIIVDYDVNKKRVPLRIKTMKCAKQPLHCSDQTSVKAHECCNFRYENRHLACVEIIDQVLVFYKNNTSGILNVAVGCSCMIHNETEVTTPAGNH